MQDWTGKSTSTCSAHGYEKRRSHGDERTYDYTLALRAVTTIDFMTADWARFRMMYLKRYRTEL